MPELHDHAPADLPAAILDPGALLTVHPAYREGLRQFNAGHFFECHETLEGLWQSALGEERLLLQGLIQLAVAVLKWQRGNRRGALFLYRRALLKWRSLPGRFAGLEIVSLRARTTAFFAPLETATAVAPIPHCDLGGLPVLRIDGVRP